MMTDAERDALFAQGEELAKGIEAKVEQLNALGGAEAEVVLRSAEHMRVAVERLSLLGLVNPELAERARPFVERAQAAFEKLKVNAKAQS